MEARKVPDNKASFDIDIKPFSIVVADRGYCDYALLYHWDSSGVFFVVRHKSNMRYARIEERPLPEKRAQNVLIDEIDIAAMGFCKGWKNEHLWL